MRIFFCILVFFCLSGCASKSLKEASSVIPPMPVVIQKPIVNPGSSSETVSVIPSVRLPSACDAPSQINAQEQLIGCDRESREEIDELKDATNKWIAKSRKVIDRAEDVANQRIRSN